MDRRIMIQESRGKGKRGGIITETPCANCGKKIENYKSYFKRYRNHFCSEECSQKFHCGEKHGNWVGGREVVLKRFLMKQRNNIKYILNHRIRAGIRHSLKGSKKNQKWEKLVGYTINDLRERLEVTMPRYYTWKDFLEGKIEIDHIIPIDAFNFDKPGHPDFQRCWALKNLRLLPMNKNRSKHNKLVEPFQPLLALEV